MILMLTPEQRNEIVSALGDYIHTDECAQRLSHSDLVQIAFAEVILRRQWALK